MAFCTGGRIRSSDSIQQTQHSQALLHARNISKVLFPKVSKIFQVFKSLKLSSVTTLWLTTTMLLDSTVCSVRLSSSRYHYTRTDVRIAPSRRRMSLPIETISADLRQLQEAVRDSNYVNYVKRP